MSAERMNRWDSMLAWLAHQKSHKWANVKLASQKLSILDDPEKERTPIGHAMFWTGPLFTLGHAEFDPGKNTVSASAPGLLKSSSSSCAVMYGYWGPKRTSSLRRTGLTCLVHHPRRGPTCHAIKCETNQIAAVAEELGVWLAEDSSVALLERLPSISAVLTNLARSELSAAGYWERFDYISNRRWRWRTSQTPLVQPGLYKRKSGQSAIVYVAPDTVAYLVKTLDEQAAAKWDQAPKGDWYFDGRLRRLLIPYGMPNLPTLVSRGLTMRSARLPVTVQFDGSRWLSYVSVGEEQAIQAARIMEQDVTTRNLANV